MISAASNGRKSGGHDDSLESGKHYRELLRRNILRLFLSYLAPFILLTTYFHLQYRANVAESRRLHLKSIAEHQANMLDLFLQERLVNLNNQIDDPKLSIPPSSAKLQTVLDELMKDSDAFIDVGYFDSTGIQQSYAGPIPALEKKDYSREVWFKDLKLNEDNFIITDIYLGFRKKPHFTIAVSRVIEGDYVVMRATIDPEKFYEYIASLERSGEVLISIVNREGYYQLATPRMGTPLEFSSIIPPTSQKLGTEKIKINGSKIKYAYSWLNMADWAIIVQWSDYGNPRLFSGTQLNILAFALMVMIIICTVIIFRAKRLVQFQKERDIVRTQLEHAAKLASVGELAAGIAHEINNPLAIISEKTGLMKDMMNPEFGLNPSVKDFAPHLEAIHDAVFRGRDITRKLLSFVRKTNPDLKPLQIHKLLDAIVDGFLEREMAASDIEIVKEYAPDIPQIVSDWNQLNQVILNLLKNAADAIKPPGKITITTSCKESDIVISIRDSGIGMSKAQLSRIFMPFYTTKAVGKGTGLGLSVSYSIIENLGGKIEVESTLGEGSVFSIRLPLEMKKKVK